MNPCRALCVVPIVLCANLCLAQEHESFDNKITIQGRQFEIYPPEKLRLRGLEPPDIPQDENAAWVYLRAINAMTPLPNKLAGAHEAALGGDWPGGEDGERLAAWIGDNRAALDLVRQASQMRDHYMPFMRGDTDALLAALLPTLGPERRLAKMLAVDATYQMSRGDASAAIDNYLTAQRMAHHVGNGKTLIEGLVGIAIGGVADRGLMRIADAGYADSEELKSAVAEMQQLAETLPSFEQMVRAEQQWVESCVDDMIDVPGFFGYVSSGFGTGPTRDAAPTGWTRLQRALRRLYLPDRAIKKNFSRHYDALIKTSKTAEDGTVGDIIEESKLFEQIPAWDFVTRMMMPSLSRAHELTLRGKSNFVRTRLRLAAAAYKADHGRDPPTLASLVPLYIAEAPADPMTGYDFDYEATGGAEGGPGGLAMVSRENEEELRKKRRTPAILNPRASKWRRFVRNFAKRYQFSDPQQAAAEAVLRDVEARAADFERAQGARIQQLIEAGKSEAAAEKMGPLDRLFGELKKRLDALPTTQQRAHAKENAKKSD